MRLNWQNVAAPEFSGINAAYRTMSDLLGRATASGSAIVDSFSKANSDAADRAIMQRLAAVQDPSQFDPIAIIGGLGDKASMAMLGDVANRQQFLLANDAVRGQEQRADYGQTRLEGANTRMDAARPAAQAYFLARGRGDEATANRMLLEDPTLAGLDARQFADIASEGDVFHGREVTLHNQDRTRRDERFRDSAAPDAERLDAAGYNMTTDPIIRDQILQDAAAEWGWTPEQMQRARAYSGGGLGGTTAAGTTIGTTPAVAGATGTTGAAAAISAAAGPGAIGTNGTGSGVAQVSRNVIDAPTTRVPYGSSGFVYDAPQQTVATALAGAGFTPAAIAGMLGNFQIEGGYGKGQGDGGSNKARADGGSASGVPQWREERRDAFQAKYGVAPHEATLEQQSEHILWELTTPEGRKSAGISEENANKIINATDPIEAAELVDKYYERSNGEHRDKRVSAARDAYEYFGGDAAVLANVENVALGTPDPLRSLTENLATQDRSSDRNIGNLTSVYAKAMTDRNNPAEAAAAFVAKRGGNQMTILGMINDIINESAPTEGPDKGKSKVNAAEAAAILELSLDDPARGLDLWGVRDFFFGGLTGATGGAGNVDSNYASGLIRDVADGGPATRIRDDATDLLMQQNINTLEAQATALAARLKQHQELAKRRANLAQFTPAIQAEYDAAVAAVAEARKDLNKFREELPPEEASNASASPGTLPEVEDRPTSYGLRDWRDISRDITRRR